MTPGRGGRSLGERAAASGVPSRSPDPTPDAGPTYAATGTGAGDDGRQGREGREGRHCWVRDPPEASGIWPGLLVEWRQGGGTWQGRVAYTVPGPYGPALVEAWLPAARLEPR